jgi:O-antigen/teichoic acid export membrane protein
MFLAVIAGSGVMAKISNLESQGKNIDKEITNTLSFTSMFAIPLFFGSLVLSRPIIITIYGPEYQASAPLLVGLSVYMVLQTQASPIQSIINGIDMPNIDMKVSGVTLVLNVVIGIPLVLSIGSIGVVIATVIAEGTRYGLFGTVLYQEKGISPVSRALLCQIFAGAIMFLVVKAAFEYLGVGSWIDLGIFLCIGGGIYFGVLTTIDSFFRQTFYAVFDDAITYLQLRFNLM